MMSTCIDLKSWAGVCLVLLSLAGGVYAQDSREVDLIAQLGREEILRREAAAAAEAEAEPRALLEEQSRLKEAYRKYLGVARRSAQKLVQSKQSKVSAERVESLRRQARLVIDEVDDQNKQRVHDELDPIYAQLEQAIAITPEELYASDPQLRTLRQQLLPGSDGGLDWVDDAAILYALCPDNRQGEVIAGNVPLRDRLSKDEAAAIDACNRRRLILGLQPLAIDLKLVACGRDHSSDMIKHNFFAHESPVPGKTTPWDRAKNFGTIATGENIAAGYKNGEAVTMGWWYSPGHLKNMMARGHKRIGVGQEQQHYTQMFGQ